MIRATTRFLGLAACAFALVVGSPARADDPLPSWNDRAPKQTILEFVARTTKAGTPDFVPPDERIATVDNDGTLWCEQPMYVQAAFVVDRVRELAARHPQWQTKEPFRSILNGDRSEVAKLGEQGIADVVMTTHAGMTPEEFEAIAKAWLTTAKHPRYGRLYTDLVYQPMLELLAYLRANGFKTFIVSGGGTEFMRAWTQAAYGIPPEQVIGSTIKTAFQLRDGKAVLVRVPKIDFIDDGDGKPIGINRSIGRRPVAALGNSDGDLQMLQWTTAGPGVRFGLIVHHTDAEREYAYDRGSLVGRLAKALDEAPAQHWTVVDMKADWKVIFPFQKK